MAKTLEQFTTECTSELQAKRDSSDGIFKQVNNERLPINDSDFAQMVVDCANNKLDVQDNGYKTARQEAYGSWQQQMDMQFWDTQGNTTVWIDHIAKVKSDNPKPS